MPHPTPKSSRSEAREESREKREGLRASIRTRSVQKIFKEIRAQHRLAEVGQGGHPTLVRGCLTPPNCEVENKVGRQQPPLTGTNECPIEESSQVALRDGLGHETGEPSDPKDNQSKKSRN